MPSLCLSGQRQIAGVLYAITVSVRAMTDSPSLATPTRKHKYEEVDVSEMTVCNLATVHSVFISEVSSVKYSWTKTDVFFC